jgi:hypothetical protein
MTQSAPALVCSCFYKSTSPADFSSHRALVPGCAGFFDVMGVRQSVVKPDLPKTPEKQQLEDYKCACGEVFTHLHLYKDHRARNKAPCRGQAPLVDLDNRCNHFLSSSHLSPTSKITAFLGDLLHKKGVVEHFQQLDAVVSTYFSNSHQAWYILTARPDLVPPPESGNPPSIHTLGTIFEYHYETEVNFRFQYMNWLPDTPKPAPSTPPGFRLFNHESIPDISRQFAYFDQE